MCETFVWNLNDSVVTPEHLAQTLIKDYVLPQNHQVVIMRVIQEQLSDFKVHISASVGD
ncbi:uncharacterized protein HD556DRAFT_1203398, partial [Suillus plorans]